MLSELVLIAYHSLVGAVAEESGHEELVLERRVQGAHSEVDLNKRELERERERELERGT